MLLLTGVRNQPVSQRRLLALGDHPTHDVRTVQVQNDLEVAVQRGCGIVQFRNVHADAHGGARVAESIEAISASNYIGCHFGQDYSLPQPQSGKDITRIIEEDYASNAVGSEALLGIAHVPRLPVNERLSYLSLLDCFSIVCRTLFRFGACVGFLNAFSSANVSAAPR